MALVTEEQVIKVLQQYNPLWRDPNAILKYSKPQKRLAYNEAMKAITHQDLWRGINPISNSF